MRFLLNIQVRLPGEWTQDQRADLVRRETEAAVETPSARRRRATRRRVPARIVSMSGRHQDHRPVFQYERHQLLKSAPAMLVVGVSGRTLALRSCHRTNAPNYVRERDGWMG